MPGEAARLADAHDGERRRPQKMLRLGQPVIGQKSDRRLPGIGLEDPVALAVADVRGGGEHIDRDVLIVVFLNIDQQIPDHVLAVRIGFRLRGEFRRKLVDVLQRLQPEVADVHDDAELISELLFSQRGEGAEDLADGGARRCGAVDFEAEYRSSEDRLEMPGIYGAVVLARQDLRGKADRADDGVFRNRGLYAAVQGVGIDEHAVACAERNVLAVDPHVHFAGQHQSVFEIFMPVQRQRLAVHPGVLIAVDPERKGRVVHKRDLFKILIDRDPFCHSRLRKICYKIILPHTAVPAPDRFFNGFQHLNTVAACIKWRVLL